MSVRIHLLEDVGDATLLVDDERGPGNAHVLLAHERLELPHAVGFGHAVRNVGQERVGQFVLPFELGLLLNGVGAATQDLRIESLEPREGVAKLARLTRSTRGIGLRVEEEHHPATAKLTQPRRAAIIGQQLEIGRRGSDRRIAIRCHVIDSPPMSTAMMAF